MNDWKVNKREDYINREEYIYLTGKVTGSYKFADGNHIHTSEILGMAQFKDYIMFETHNSFYKCFKSEHVLGFDDLLYLLDEFPQFTKESFKQFFQEIQHLSTLRLQDDENRKVNLFPRDCENGMLLIFNQEDDFFVDYVITKKVDEEPKLEEFLHQNVDRYQMLVYQKLSEDERIMFCSYFRNEDIVVISGWNKTYGDLYVLNCSDTPMHFRSKVQDEYIDTNQILKVIVRNKDL